jgi:hypothetical protein
MFKKALLSARLSALKRWAEAHRFALGHKRSLSGVGTWEGERGAKSGERGARSWEKERLSGEPPRRRAPVPTGDLPPSAGRGCWLLADRPCARIWEGEQGAGSGELGEGAAERGAAAASRARVDRELLAMGAARPCCLERAPPPSAQVCGWGWGALSVVLWPVRPPLLCLP